MGSIKQKVFMALITAGLVPVAVMLLVNLTVVRDAMIISEKQKIKELSGAVARQLTGIMESAWNDLEVLRSNPNLTNAANSDKVKKESFDRLKQHYDYLSSITLLDTKGWPVMPGAADPTRKDQSKFFKRALAGEVVVPEPDIPIERGIGEHGTIGEDFTFLIQIYLPIFQPGESKPHNVVRADIRFDQFWEVIDSTSVGEKGYFVLINSLGNTLAHKDRSRIQYAFDDQTATSHWANHPEGVYVDDEGVSQVYLSTVLQPHNKDNEKEWTLICFQPESEVHSLAYRIVNYTLGAALSAFVVAALVGLFLAKGLASPVIEASKVALKVSRGELESVMPESGGKEMRGLATSFNKMVVELKGHRAHLESLVQSRTQSLLESQADLQDLTAQLRATYESTPEAIMVVRPTGEVLAANKRVRDFFGLDGARLLKDGLAEGTSSRADLVKCFEDADDFEQVWRRHTDSSGLVHKGEWKVHGEADMQLSVYSAPVMNSAGNTFARLWMFRDMTEQRRLELGLQQSTKMEAIGRLSGGVAHDFNNLLTGIIGNLSLSELMGDMPKENGDLVLAAKRAAERAAGIVKQLLAFSRQNQISLQPCCANKLIREVQEILTPGLDPSIQLHVNLDDDEPYVIADGNQIDQVLMNFCVNARDALPDGGSITVTTSRVNINLDALPRQTNCKPGNYVAISVQDDGTGMPEEVREKIFEPFFTTKEQGKGTGLGLATSYGIVQDHSGWINCESEVGKGTTFTVYIPQCDKPAQSKEEGKSTPVVGGTETILIVDDELIVRTVAENVLQRQGYKVETASDGREALEVVARCGNSVSAIMLDLTMPRMSGRETFKELRSGKYPHIPVVICSGYLVELISFEEDSGSVPEGVVQKPYQVDVLAKEIRRVIDSVAVATVV
ncbi:MAG: two-component system cell cycle sensor histidine kinase/response regulator CckA [Verrucomicrobiales bacterium]|jgi:two-component system cell cycle sensor histidine kinase/response regulator CckA